MPSGTDNRLWAGSRHSGCMSAFHLISSGIRPKAAIGRQRASGYLLSRSEHGGEVEQVGKRAKNGPAHGAARIRLPAWVLTRLYVRSYEPPSVAHVRLHGCSAQIWE
jgi:hypothetical protein